MLYTYKIQIIIRSPEELKTQANISAPLPSKPTEEKPYVRKLQRVESPARVPAESITTPSKSEPQVQSTTVKNDNDKNTGKSKNESLKRSIVQKVDIAEVIKSERKKKPIKKIEPMEVDNYPHGLTENIEKEFLFVSFGYLQTVQ